MLREQLELFPEDQGAIWESSPENLDYDIDNFPIDSEETLWLAPIYWEDLSSEAKFRVIKLCGQELNEESFVQQYVDTKQPVAFINPIAFTGVDNA